LTWKWRNASKSWGDDRYIGVNIAKGGAIYRRRLVTAGPAASLPAVVSVLITVYNGATMERIVPKSRRMRQALAGAGLLGLAALLPLGARSVAETAKVVPAPAVDEPAGAVPSEVAVFAGGCFWGVQGVFQHVKGVTGAVSGYAGGGQSAARYDAVSTGATGHAESVRVTFDPRQISYGQLPRIFFSVAHDPTELNRQGPDYGTQYRSAVFPVTEEKARVARAYIAQLDQAHVFGAPVVTKIEPDRAFFPAEGYHQDYLTLHPNAPYIVYNDLPKIEALKQSFPSLWRPDPVLVAKAE
jgi:peptide-methionine (S)-S-oxide reductase